MVKMIKERIITLAEVKKILEEKSKKEELSAIEQSTLEYARKFAKIDLDKAMELYKKLKELELSDFTIVQIINILPDTIEELRTLMIKEEKEYDTDFLNKILEIIKEYKE